MAEKVRKRISKWDVVAEDVGTEMVHDKAPAAKIDSPSMNLAEMNYKNHEQRQISGEFETEPSAVDLSGELFVQEKGKSIMPSDEKPELSKHIDPESDRNDGVKKQHCKLALMDSTMASSAEVLNRPLNGSHPISPAAEDRRQRYCNTTPTDGWSRSDRKRARSRSRSRGRSRSRSRSLSYDSRSRSRSRSWSRSRSRSPYASKQDCERWTNNVRIRGAVPPCRDFAAGRCRRGSECRFLHEGGSWRQLDRHNDSGSTDDRESRYTDDRESRYESGRYQELSSKESFSDSREKNNYPRDNISRKHEDQFRDGWDNSKQHRVYKSNDRCFDYIKGRCHRGEACRYIHHDASSDGGWSSRDESQGRLHDRRDGSDSFSRRSEPQKVTAVPCKFFLEGRCRRGESCKFSHQAGSSNNPEDILHNDRQPPYVDADITPNASEMHGQSTHSGVANPLLSGGPNEDANREAETSVQQTAMQSTEGVHEGNVPADVNFVNNLLSATSTINQTFGQSGQSQTAPQLVNASLESNPPFQQFAPLPPLNGQMKQVIHPFPQSGHGHGQFTAIQHSPGAHLVESSLQNQPVHPPQNFDIRTKTQQNLMRSHGENQKGLIHPHNAQSKPNFQVGQIQQSLPPQIGHPKQEFVVPANSQYILCHNLQNQQLGASLLLPNEPNQPALTQPSTNLHNLSSAETTASSSLQQPVQGINSDNTIAHKVVTSEQAAKITDLSASLAQFFGTTALNPQTPTPTTPGLLNPGSIVAAAVPMPNELEPVSGSEEKPSIQLEAMDRSRAGGDAFSKEDQKAETFQNNKEVLAQLQNVEVEAPNDGDSKKSKEAKGLRVFKCALVEFVKDILKPTWKEGQLSKEAHKTIVKKVVDKVMGSIQGPNLPQTLEKVDLYISNSKPKLSKLVQAYVEKYAKG